MWLCFFVYSEIVWLVEVDWVVLFDVCGCYCCVVCVLFGIGWLQLVWNGLMLSLLWCVQCVYIVSFIGLYVCMMLRKICLMYCL